MLVGVSDPIERSANLLGALGLALADTVSQEAASASGLSVVEASALNAIAQSPRCSVAFVADVLDLTHPGAVRVIDRLVAAGHARRTPGPDGRTVGLMATAAGRSSVRSMRNARRTTLMQLIGTLAADVAADLDRVLDPLLAALTSSERQSEHICRLCDEAVCPQDRCPVTLAAGGP
jgi:MarR family transcriptional regulator, negative regulator of the multidrug operon emrRAB